MERDQEFIETVVKSLVENPNDVKTDRKVDEMGVLITLHINPSDMGTVIGREGATAKALRTLLRIVGAKNNSRVNLKLEEPEGRSRPTTRKEKADYKTEKSSSKEKEEVATDVVDDLKL